MLINISSADISSAISERYNMWRQITFFIATIYVYLDCGVERIIVTFQRTSYGYSQSRKLFSFLANSIKQARIHTGTNAAVLEK